jgi:multidrug efflux pump subunit AcrB
MLVDDSIVVVENIHRHLEERVHTWSTKLQAILKAVDEVWPWVILSTITKILSFAWMFFVTWMMWEYMWPIPKFAIVALLLSILIAFTINPWVSFLTTKEVTENDKVHEKKKKSRFDIRIIYVKIMEYFISDKPNTKKRRKIFKLVFWVSLLLVIILPISTWIFKARMLPKSNQNQVYLWIDAPRWTNIDKMMEVEKSVEEFFLRNKNLEKDLNIVWFVSSTIWTPFMWDFANMFRWGANRWWEYQISSRINLIPKELDEDRLKSEEFVIKTRPLLRQYLLSIYPDLIIRLLEDPPGPPVRATFMMKIKTESNSENLNNFTNKVYSEVRKVASKEDLVDLWTSLSTTYKKIEINLDSESVSRAWLTAEQVAYTLAIAKNSMTISLVKDSESLEQTNIILWVKNDENETTKLLDNITFTNNKGQKINLSGIAKINYTFVTPEINTDSRQETNFIYSEMWDNSVIYPVIKLYSVLKSKEFLWNDYKFLWWDFYGLHYKWIKDW